MAGLGGVGERACAAAGFMLQCRLPPTVPRSPNLFKRVFLPVLGLFLLTAFLVRMAFDRDFDTALLAGGREVRGLFDPQFWQQWWRVGRVMEVAHQNYLHDNKVTYDKLADSALNHVLDGLDRYTDYLSPESYQEFERESKQHPVGIGVDIERRNGTIQIVRIYRGSPAAEKGWQPNDRILAIDGTDVRDFTVAGVADLLHGPENSKVVVRRERPGEFTQEETLTRGGFDVPSIRDSEVRPDGVGYLRVTQFGDNTGGEFADTLSGMMGPETLRGLIIDLRDNTGGLLEADVEVKMLQTLLPDNSSIVTTKDRDGHVVQSLKTPLPAAPPSVDGSPLDQPEDVHYAGPVVVLVNENTASAAEIVAGALQDHHRAVLVGQRTYGKSVVQSIITLSDGGALHLTTEDYFLPSGHSIPLDGIAPDVFVPQTSDEHESLRIQNSDLRPDLHRFTNATFVAAFGYAPVPDPEIETAASLIRAVTPNFAK